MLMYRKFEMSAEQWLLCKALIEVKHEAPDGEALIALNRSIVECVAVIPPLCLNWEVTEDGKEVCVLFSDNVFVDILFNSTIPFEFVPYLVWPASCGVHSFAGLEHLYEQAYQQHLASQ